MLFGFCTGVEIILMMLRPGVHFVADHPFIVLIVSAKRNVLFMGRLSKI